MADFNNMRTNTVTRDDAAIDQGLRSYMLGVYNLMMIGLAITGIVAMGVAQFAMMNAEFAAFLYSIRFITLLLPLGLVLFLQFRIDNLSTSTARMLFLAYATLIGVSFSVIFFAFTGGSIARTFFVTAASFGALSLYGYTTKRDLRPMGAFLVIGLIGLLLAIIVNIFWPAPALTFAISAIGVLIFAGLTAYDTQAIKEMYFEGDMEETRGRKIVLGALWLYIDFINMFQFLLSFLGNRD